MTNGSEDTTILSDWKLYIDGAATSGKPAITTLQSFGGDAELFAAALGYARAKGVDVMVAAESDGTFA